MGKDRDRKVYKRDDGQWVNKRNVGKASSLHDTQKDAIASVADMLGN